MILWFSCSSSLFGSVSNVLTMIGTNVAFMFHDYIYFFFCTLSKFRYEVASIIIRSLRIATDGNTLGTHSLEYYGVLSSLFSQFLLATRITSVSAWFSDWGRARIHMEPSQENRDPVKQVVRCSSPGKLELCGCNEWSNFVDILCIHKFS